MPFMTHVVLHLTMCSAVNKLPATTPVDIVLHEVDGTGRQKFDQKFQIERGISDVHTLDYDSPRGEFRVTVSVPKYGCNAGDFLYFITDHTRNVSMTAAPGAPNYGEPMLLQGTAPESFSYASPQFVLLDKSVMCDKPVGDLIPSNFRIETDPDGYYLWAYSTPDLLARGNMQLALQVGTSTGEYHYVRIKFPFPQRWDGWPYSLTFDLPDYLFDELSGKPTDTLTCLKLTRTSGGPG